MACAIETFGEGDKGGEVLSCPATLRCFAPLQHDSGRRGLDTGSNIKYGTSFAGMVFSTYLF
jgi:hypothetical protein